MKTLSSALEKISNCPLECSRHGGGLPAVGGGRSEGLPRLPLRYFLAGGTAEATARVLHIPNRKTKEFHYL